MNITELKKQLTGLGVVFSPGTLKEDLETLLDNAMEALDKENEALSEKGSPLEDTKESSPVNTLLEAAIKQEEGSANLWDKTSDLILQNQEVFQGASDKKERQKLFTLLMDQGVDLSLIPETGLNRKGEEFLLRKKGNKIKWSSWAVSARIFQNTGDIWKGVELLGWDVVFPDGEIVSRYELLSLIKKTKVKVSEPPETTIDRCLEMVMKKIDELPKDSLDLISQRMLDLNVRFSDWKAEVK
jgi:uncharacterized protein YqgV (UPF0045/DUF77 family)